VTAKNYRECHDYDWCCACHDGRVDECERGDTTVCGVSR
jgi:hypothetical protein